MDLGAMTGISGNNMGFLQGDERSPHQMVEFLKEGAKFRSFSDILRQVYPNEDLETRLINGLQEITGENRDSLAKKVRNWLKGKNTPQNRQALFQISFALGLDEDRASKLLGTAAETGIHYRNPEELAFAFALRTGTSYERALKLKEMAKDICGDAFQGIRKADMRRESPLLYTRQLKASFAGIRTESELIAFFKEHKDELV